MPKKKTTDDSVLMSEQADGFAVTPVTSEPKQSINRLSVGLKEDGSIDFSSMRSATREKLEKALQSLPATSGKTESVPALTVNREFIPHMYDSMCAGIQIAGQKLFKWPHDLTKHMQFSEDEKEKLKEPTAKVMEKHAPKWLMTHQEEFALAQAIIVAAKSMVERAAMLYVMETQAKAQVQSTVDAVEEIGAPAQ